MSAIQNGAAESRLSPDSALPAEKFFSDLTVVIPTYQCASFLPAAIESAIHSPAAHILVTDDASGPDVLRVAETYQRSHPDRIRILRSGVRRGTAININEAVRQVTTSYFAKLDGDDVLFPGYLDAAFTQIQARPTLALLAGHDRRIDAGEVLRFDPSLRAGEPPAPGSRVMSGIEAYRFILAWSPNPSSSGAIYRTDAFLEIGGFDPTIRWGEDWEIWLRFAQRWEVAYCDSVSAFYRIHASSTTAQEISQNRICFGYEAVFRRAAEVCHDPLVRPLLRRAFIRVARLYAAAASREIRNFGRRWLLYSYHALRALFTAFFQLDRVGKAQPQR